jgi:DNA-directed RNA polymerase subunit RPC12/RpoP
MPPAGSTWIVTLKCYKCGSLFTLKGIPAIAIAAASDSSQCPKCGSKNLPKVPAQKAHRVVNLLKHRHKA